MAAPWSLVAWLLVGYLLTVAVEGPVLWFALAPGHPPSRRVAAALWLTGCTYPVVVLALPPFFAARWAYLAAAETFAPLAECALFLAAFGPETTRRDLAAVAAANLVSFAAGEAYWLWRG